MIGHSRLEAGKRVLEAEKEVALSVLRHGVAFHNAAVEHAEEDGPAESGVEKAADGARSGRTGGPEAAATVHIDCVIGDAERVDLVLGNAKVSLELVLLIFSALNQFVLTVMPDEAPHSGL